MRDSGAGGKYFVMRYIGFFAVAFLAACSATTPPSVPVELPAKNCAQDEFSKYLWRPEGDLSGLTLPANTRIIRPDMAVTMDFVPSRLNIAVGKSGRIERVYCG